MNFKQVTCGLIVVFSLLECGLAEKSSASMVVANWVNSDAKNAVTELNAGRVFVTNFKGTNDLTVTQTQGFVSSIYNDRFYSSPGNNPSYLTTYVGSAAKGTGNGSTGVLSLLESSWNPSSLRFDFSTPLNVFDKIVIADIDAAEQFQIRAYSLVGTSYVPLSLTGWTEQKFTGMTGTMPNSNWANWDPATGIFTSTYNNTLNEPLNVLTPDQKVSRLEITRLSSPPIGGTAEFQFVSEVSPVPEPSTYALFSLGLGGLAFWKRRQNKA